MHMRFVVLWLWEFLLAAGLIVLPTVCCGQIRFVDVSKSSGVDFLHEDGGSGERFIVEYTSAGLAVFDFDGDGLLDIYLLNGGKLQGENATGPNRLYRNLGNMRFQDVTEQAGVGHRGHGMGVTAADVDQDGDQDLFVNNFGANVFYRNNGDGTFTEDRDSILAEPAEVGAGVCFLDANQDGHLDLYVANYVDFRFENHVYRRVRGKSVYPSPQDFEPQSDRFYFSDGEGGWHDATESSGIGAYFGTGMGSIVTDYDRDGDMDIFVCNDVMPNFLYQNDGTGKFEEFGLLAGVAYDFAGVMQGSMGVDCGDVDGDGNLDLLVTSYEEENPVLYRNSGDGFYEDVTVNSGDLVQAAPLVTWGVGLCDLDNDMDLDLFMACGHLMDNIQQTNDTQQYATKNMVLENAAGRFRNVTSSSNLGPEKVSRGASIADLDQDGRLDVVVLNSNARPTVLKNDCQSENGWLQVRLVGTRCNRDAVGARVKLVSSKGAMIQEVYSGRSYQGHNGMVLHFGLIQGAKVEAIEVDWPDGEWGNMQRFESIALGDLNVLVQGE
ncbi:MAG: CRTAC1 family protein [Planctomycetota bacterium]